MLRGINVQKKKKCFARRTIEATNNKLTTQQNSECGGICWLDAHWTLNIVNAVCYTAGWEGTANEKLQKKNKQEKQNQKTKTKYYDKGL